MRQFKLKTMSDIRRFLSKTINRLDAGEIDENRGRTLAYMVSVLKMVIESGDIETRLEKLESQFKEKESGK